MYWLLGFLDSIYWEIGYAICHQLPEKSLHFGGRQLPVCARDTGLFLGAAAAVALLFLIHGKGGKSYPGWRRSILPAAMLLPTMIDGGTAYLGWRATSNALRLGTGLLAGAGLAALVFPLISRELFPSSPSEPVLARGDEMACLPLSAVMLFLFLSFDWGGAYWLWSTLICLSIVSVLTLLGFTLLSLLFHQLKDRPGSPARAALLCTSLILIAMLLTTGNRLHWAFAG